MPTMIGRSTPVPRRQARSMAICLSGMEGHGTGPDGRRRPPARGPHRGMSPGPRGWENPPAEQTVATPTPSPSAPRPVRLLLVDDHQVALERLESMLAAEP